MAQLSEYKEALDEFGSRVIARAQANLRKKRQIRGRSVNRVYKGTLQKELTFGYFKRGANILQWFGVKPNSPVFEPSKSEYIQVTRMVESIGRRGIVGINYMRDAFQDESRNSGKEFRAMYQRTVIKQVRLKADKYIK